MERKTYSLPFGGETTDLQFYLDTWIGLIQEFTEAYGGTVVGYDPGLIWEVYVDPTDNIPCRVELTVSLAKYLIAKAEED